MIPSESTGKRYTYQVIQGSGICDVHYRIVDTVSDDRVATCYIEENARLVTDLMNRGTSQAATDFPRPATLAERLVAAREAWDLWREQEAGRCRP